MDLEHAGMNPIAVKKNIVKGLLQLIDDVPDRDDHESVSRLIAYLNGLLRVKSVVPPTAEIMSIIKHQKPKLYHATRRSILSTSHLNMLFQIDMSYELASERLRAFGHPIDDNSADRP